MGRGRFPTAKKAEVERLVTEQREKEQADARIRNPWNNNDTARKGVRKHALGTFQANNGLGAQHYDVRYNAHVCKEIIENWGRNAYNGDPIEVTIGGRQCLVACHIDITTPRDNFLWHGNDEGPHIVIEGYMFAEDDNYQKLEDNSIWLSPNDVYMLWAHQVKDGNITWPWHVTKKLEDRIAHKQAAIARRQNRDDDSDSEDLDFNLFG